MYSFRGVKAISKMVNTTNKTENIPPKTKAFNRFNLNEKRSSKVSSFNTTKRYLKVSFSFNLSFLLFSIFLHSKQRYNVFEFPVLQIHRTGMRAVPVKASLVKIHFIHIFPCSFRHKGPHIFIFLYGFSDKGGRYFNNRSLYQMNLGMT